MTAAATTGPAVDHTLKHPAAAPAVVNATPASTQVDSKAEQKAQGKAEHKAQGKSAHKAEGKAEHKAQCKTELKSEASPAAAEKVAAVKK